jgi:hypothetical protein
MNLQTTVMFICPASLYAANFFSAFGKIIGDIIQSVVDGLY